MNGMRGREGWCEGRARGLRRRCCAESVSETSAIATIASRYSRRMRPMAESACL